MQLFETQASQIARAGDDIGGYLDGAQVHLTKSEIAISPTTPLADLTTAEADYNTYTAQDITWDTATVADDGTVEVIGTVPGFRPTDALAPNNIWALFITNGDGDELYFLGSFDAPPLPMNTVLDQITVTVRYRPATDTIVVVVS